MLDQKLSYHNKKVHKVDTTTFKASQYQHDTQAFIKKLLSQRHVIIYDKWIQRDLYNAFLLMNSSPNLKSTNQSSREVTYPEFMIHYDQCILDIKNGGKKTSANFGIKI